MTPKQGEKYMTFKIDAGEYQTLCNQLYSLISDEIENTTDVEVSYPQLVIMYEFFRLLRGEAFTDFREPTPDFQKRLYEMENELKEKVFSMKSRIEDQEKAQYWMDMMKKSFEVD